MYQRNIRGRIIEALSDTPVVTISGPRQSGKSTLAKSIADELSLSYVTLDRTVTRGAANRDPEGFLDSLPPGVVIDEVQLAPTIFRAIKAVVDRNRKPGMFLLTGSVNVLGRVEAADPLVGRVQSVELLPLSQGEISSHREDLVSKLFDMDIPWVEATQTGTAHLIKRAIIGGYPEAVIRKKQTRRQDWFDTYIDTLIFRGIATVSKSQSLDEFPRLIQLFAARASGLLNYESISRELQVQAKTVSRYVSVLEYIFILLRVPAWHANLGKRLIKREKLQLVDSGLMAHLLHLDESSQINPGSLVENFVGSEIRKQLGWTVHRGVRLYHFRSTTGQEVDIVLEDRSGNIVGIEIKSASAIAESDFKGLLFLSDLLGDRFLCGIVLYAGPHTVSYGDNLFALPIEALWRV